MLGLLIPQNSLIILRSDFTSHALTHPTLTFRFRNHNLPLTLTIFSSPKLMEQGRIRGAGRKCGSGQLVPDVFFRNVRVISYLLAR
jgi:hypothetical protein